jgi:hypothetical protein
MMPVATDQKIVDPFKFAAKCWPSMRLSKQQIEIVESVRDNDETFVPAGNGLGKDFISAFIAIWWMCSRSPARVVTTSVKGDQLKDVLWGEIRSLIEQSQVRLPLQYNHMYIRQVRRDGTFVPKSELVGQCIAKGESLLGRHLPRDIPRTLVIYDEASGIDTTVYESASTWAHRALVISNCFPCENFFRKGVKDGDLKSSYGKHLKRKVIHVRAEDSPNIQQAFADIRAGKRKPEKLLILSNDQPWGIYSENEYVTLSMKWITSHQENPKAPVVIPGMVGINEYLDRRANYDWVMQCISLDGRFYEGSETLLFPPDWLDACAHRAKILGRTNRKAVTMGVDSAEGGDSTVWAVSDHLGLLHLESMKTFDTAIIAPRTIALMQEWGIQPVNVLFDRGGGGKQHADRLRELGYNVRTVAFGEPVTPDLKARGVINTLGDRKEFAEERYTYFNRRAEMYGMLSRRMDAGLMGELVYAIPAEYTELRRQLAPIPKRWDNEGRMVLPPKRKRDKNDTRKTLTDLIGHSPDEADATVLAVYGLTNKARTFTVTVQ